MKRSSRHRAWWATILFVLGLAAGCVERRFVITSNVPGAIVYDEKGQPMGATPVDRQFTYYGKYKFTLVKDGFETQVVEEQVKTPWYEFLGLDFVSENLLPWTIRDIRRFHYTLQPAQLVPPESVLQNGTLLRERGKVLQVPTPVPQAPVPIPATGPGSLPPIMPPPGN
jgi:hypothetical protein